MTTVFRTAYTKDLKIHHCSIGTSENRGLDSSQDAASLPSTDPTPWREEHRQAGASGSGPLKPKCSNLLPFLFDLGDSQCQQQSLKTLFPKSF